MKNVYDYLNEYGIELTEDSGCEIARPKDAFYTHTGIILGRNKYTWEKMVFHNHRESNGPAIVTITKFNNGYQAHYTNRPMDSWDVVLLRSFQQLDAGLNYDLPVYNCHHASAYSRTGKSQSHGVTNTIGTIAVIAIIAALFK
jgi:hypothetical protein